MPNDTISVNPSGSKVVDWAVHNATFTVMARAAMIVLGIIIPLLGFMIKSAWDDQKSLMKEQRDDLKAISSKMVDVRVLTVTMENLNTTMNSRFDAQAKRIDKHDNEIDDLRIRFYNMPRVTK